MTNSKTLSVVLGLMFLFMIIGVLGFTIVGASLAAGNQQYPPGYVNQQGRYTYQNGVRIYDQPSQPYVRTANYSHLDRYNQVPLVRSASGGYREDNVRVTRYAMDGIKAEVCNPVTGECNTTYTDPPRTNRTIYRSSSYSNGTIVHRGYNSWPTSNSYYPTSHVSHSYPVSRSYISSSNYCAPVVNNCVRYVSNCAPVRYVSNACYRPARRVWNSVWCN